MPKMKTTKAFLEVGIWMDQTRNAGSANMRRSVKTSNAPMTFQNKVCQYISSWAIVREGPQLQCSDTCWMRESPRVLEVCIEMQV